MNNAPLVSIIMPNYNCGPFLRTAIDSVLSQTYGNWELLIQDDASTDGSQAIIEEYAAREPRIKFERNDRNKGAALSRNRAIERSEGEYLAFLDSDDVWLPKKLEMQLAFMQAHDCDFSFTQYAHIDEKGRLMGVQAKVVKHLTYGKMLRHCWPGCLTVMYRQDLHRKIYAEDVERNNDHALFLRVLKNCRNACGIPTCMALYRIRKGSISRSKLKMIKPYVEVVHDLEGHSYCMALFCVFTQVFVKVFLKYKKTKRYGELECEVAGTTV
ncbi:MAG: glycosyltransferase [Bacteroidales bacterium]|nr:glycosyltransferase [Bacteroidales bacterium]